MSLTYDPKRGQFVKSAKRSGLSAFAGADTPRWMADFLGDGLSADAALCGSLDRLRGRSRALERENPYFRRWLAELEANVLGKDGIRMTPDVRLRNGKPDKRTSKIISDWWQDFSLPENFSGTRRHGRVKFSQLALRSIARDGDVLVRCVRGYRKNVYGFAFQGIEADHLKTDHNDERQDGHSIRMGVEVDQFGEHMAYHVQTDHPGATYSANYQRAKRIPSECSRSLMGTMGDTAILPYVQERFGQDRGTPWASVAIRGLRQLGMYEEALLVAKRISAGKMGFITKQGDQEFAGDGEDPAGNKTFKAEPGTIVELEEGEGFASWDPKEDADYEVFRKGILRGIAAGLLCNYNILGNDLEGVNYSSIRQGILSERELWKMLQGWYVVEVERPMFLAALEMAILSGEIPLPMSQFERLSQVNFEGRRWDWVDPLKDLQAAEKSLELKLSSRSKVARDRGDNFGTILEENKADEELAEEMGISLDPANSKPMANEEPSNDNDEQA